jgi:hypothetical protein
VEMGDACSVRQGRAGAILGTRSKRGDPLDPRCVVAKRGADGPARRSSSVSRAWRTEPPPIHSPRAVAGHDRMARPSRRSPSRGTACGSWTRAWGQRARSSRNRPLEQPSTIARLAQGWAGLPSHSRPMRLTSQPTPAPDARAPCLVTRWSNRHLCLSCDNWLLG